MRYSKRKIFILLLSALLFLTSCTQESGTLSSQLPESIRLTINEAWNHHTICQYAYIDPDGKLHINPQFMEWVSAAKTVNGKSGAVSVVSFTDTFTEELWVLWTDGKVSYLHMTADELARRYPASKDNPTAYPAQDEVGGINRIDLAGRWQSIEEQLSGKKVSVIFGGRRSVYTDGGYGFATTDGNVYYFGWNVSAAKSDALVNGNGVVTADGKATAVVTNNQAPKTVILCEKSAVAADGGEYYGYLFLLEDGTLMETTLKRGTTEIAETAIRDTQVVRLFPDSGCYAKADGTLVFWDGEITSERKPDTLKSTANADQITPEWNMILYCDGTLEVDDDDALDWLRGVDVRIKVLSK
ncbi:MAG: hypothetical protein IJY28_09870 [Clostridia bacterium]|nr:hypothetical protein [Clostridia bacterium]